MDYLTALVADTIVALLITVSTVPTPTVIPSPTTGPAQNVPAQTPNK